MFGAQEAEQEMIMCQFHRRKPFAVVKGPIDSGAEFNGGGVNTIRCIRAVGIGRTRRRRWNGPADPNGKGSAIAKKAADLEAFVCKMRGYGFASFLNESTIKISQADAL